MLEDKDTNSNETPRTKRGAVKPLVIAAGAIVGLWAIAQFGATGVTMLSEVKRVAAVMNLIEGNYVEKPDLGRLSEGAIEGMLERLDPHSVYIPPQEQVEISERDLGAFEGIGISFVIQDEVLTVVAPITGTPADRLGIRSGDRIVAIDGINTFGITNDEVFKKLRGPKGTSVRVTIVREGVDEPLEMTIVRDTIPINSVWTYFMLDDSTGYALLNQFMATTSLELDQALRQLERKGMRRLIFDLRNDQGGRMNEAVAVADMFIPAGEVLVSRRGRSADDDTTFISTSTDDHPMDLAVIVLMNEGSASASEIVAGAIQDLDRGLIVGEKSFGKGLVQIPFQLDGGAVIRLSTAYWYAPSGRTVQRPFDKGRGEYYAAHLGGPDTTDTTARQAFKTLGGRTVYANSGITPDVVVPEGTITGATARLINARIPFEYAQRLAHKYAWTAKSDFNDFRTKFRLTDADWDGFLALAKERGVEVKKDLVAQDREYLEIQLRAEIAQQVWNSRDDYYLIRVESDPVVIKARELFPQARAVAAARRSQSKG